MKSAIEMSSCHAQPNKTWNCDQEVSGTALQIITAFVINSVFFPFPVCLSAICWTLRHKIGWLWVAGRGWLGWCLGDKALGAVVRTASDFISCGLQPRHFFFFPCTYQMTFRCALMHDLPEMSEKFAVASARTSPSFLPSPLPGKTVCRRRQWMVKGRLPDIISLPSGVCGYCRKLPQTEILP